MDIDTIQIILEALILLVLVCVSLYLAFFKSYFSEKGKNLATKEDIAHITQAVEKIKSELDYSKQSRLSLESERRAVLISYYNSYCTWLTTLQNLPIYIVEFGKEEQLVCDKLMSKSVINFEFAHSRMELFADDGELLILNSELSIATQGLQLLCFQTMTSLCISQIHMQYIENHDTSNEKLDKIKEKINEKQKHIESHNKARLELYKKIRPIQMKLREAIYDRIKNVD